MSGEKMVFERQLSPDEGSALIAQSGVSVESTSTDSSIFGDDILFKFWLPDGRCVEYHAEQESDYYGGSYTIIKWLLYARAFPESPAVIPNQEPAE